MWNDVQVIARLLFRNLPAKNYNFLSEGIRVSRKYDFVVDSCSNKINNIPILRLLLRPNDANNV